MSYKIVVEDDIIIFTIDNPPTNTITTETLQGFEKAVDRLVNEEVLKGMVITGTGRFFSGGFDLVTFANFAGPEEIIKWFSYEEEVLFKLLACPKPVVAAINGHATAAGMIIAQTCDYRVILDNQKVKVGMTEIKLGMALTPCQGEVIRYGLGSVNNFREIMYKGELITPQKAVEMGILDELAEEDELVVKAKAKISEYIDNPNRSFVHLKAIERKHVIRQAREGIDGNTYERNIATFTNPVVIASIKKTIENVGQRHQKQ